MAAEGGAPAGDTPGDTPEDAPDGYRVVDLVAEEARWEAMGLATVAERAARAALIAAGLDPRRCEVSLLAADDARLAALNAHFRGREGATNVLSWPAFAGEGAAAVSEAVTEALAEGAAAREPGGEPVLLGDVALAYETCAREAAAEGRTLADHAAHLVVHGVLHLLGHDHQDAAEAERMEAFERKILASMGVADPYGL
jgi:probable rRNA maturation factor